MADLPVTVRQMKSGVELATGRVHVLTIAPDVDRVRLVGMFFDLDKCFLLPSAMRGMREIKAQYDAVGKGGPPSEDRRGRGP